MSLTGIEPATSSSFEYVSFRLAFKFCLAFVSLSFKLIPVIIIPYMIVLSLTSRSFHLLRLVTVLTLDVTTFEFPFSYIALIGTL